MNLENGTRVADAVLDGDDHVLEGHHVRTTDRRPPDAVTAVSDPWDQTEARDRRAALESDRGRIEAILAAGAAKARARAGKVLARAKRACGLSRGETVAPAANAAKGKQA